MSEQSQTPARGALPCTCLQYFPHPVPPQSSSPAYFMLAVSLKPQLLGARTMTNCLTAVSPALGGIRPHSQGSINTRWMSKSSGKQIFHYQNWTSTSLGGHLSLLRVMSRQLVTTRRHTRVGLREPLTLCARNTRSLWGSSPGGGSSETKDRFLAFVSSCFMCLIASSTTSGAVNIS